MHSKTDLLFAQPSAWEGVGSVVGLFQPPDEYNACLSPQQADALALASDRRAIEDDLRGAMREFARLHGLPYPPRAGRASQ